MVMCQCGDDMTIKQWRYDDDDDETTSGHLINTILGKVMFCIFYHTIICNKQ